MHFYSVLDHIVPFSGEYCRFEYKLGSDEMLKTIQKSQTDKSRIGAALISILTAYIIPLNT